MGSENGPWVGISLRVQSGGVEIRCIARRRRGRGRGKVETEVN
jgi:hypothetical protein